MKWQDKGFLLSINKYNENSAVAEFLTDIFDLMKNSKFKL